MMFYCRSFLPRLIERQISFVRNTSTSTKPLDKWDLLCGVCLERKPIITRPLNELEISFTKLLMQIEVENSQKSEHEIRLILDAQRADEFKKGKISTKDLDNAVGQSGAEFEDVCLKELNAFKPASRISEADEKNDVKSTERMLDKYLLLLINETIGKDKVWLLPHDQIKEEETLRQAAERILSEKCGSKIRAKFFGNAPCGFFKYKYPGEVREKKNAIGAKIFFMKAQYLKGSVENKNLQDYCWASRTELTEHLYAPYKKAVTSFLIDDESVELTTS